MTQINLVKNRIKEVGYVDNFWAIDNYILRLGAIVHTLREKENLPLIGYFGKELGKDKPLHKNYYYILKSELLPVVKPSEPVEIIKPTSIVEEEGKQTNLFNFL